MPDAFSVDTEGLNNQIPYMQELAEQLRSVGTTLESTLDALGECWGKDAAGQQFFGQYDNPHQEWVQGVGGAGDVVDSTAQGVRTMAVQFDRLEDQNVAAVRQLQPADGGSSSTDDYDSRPGKE
ncbi:hypothetical protein GXW83_16775 [Streptacidiphilus sp. PB12-B1b]|uniref:WXG100 family type VII secretion target n=1 Tax=Streptacidiphilus sp. PB12-B1b TaxID=2705012 RepID=UPI0015FDBDC7|nr:WXG100 family type VII secretion target [Streptacidiphilus sp. PB12-B1b]QMU77117.1 hypothetical protein GXW83_16775 [Streptacidiphilus sp. PB12-B1b]